jgi:hypothetical protein
MAVAAIVGGCLHGPRRTALHDVICGIDDGVDRNCGIKPSLWSLCIRSNSRICWLYRKIASLRQIGGREVAGDAADIRSRNAAGSRKLNSESGGTGLGRRRVQWR